MFFFKSTELKIERITCILTASLHPGMTSLRFMKYKGGTSESVFSSFFFSTGASPDNNNTIISHCLIYYRFSN